MIDPLLVNCNKYLKILSLNYKSIFEAGEGIYYKMSAYSIVIMENLVLIMSKSLVYNCVLHLCIQNRKRQHMK